jgi:hypothetical protein
MRVTFTRLGRAVMAICVVQERTLVLLNHVLGLQFSICYKFSHSAKIYANCCNAPSERLCKFGCVSIACHFRHQLL